MQASKPLQQNWMRSSNRQSRSGHSSRIAPVIASVTKNCFAGSARTVLGSFENGFFVSKS